MVTTSTVTRRYLEEAERASHAAELFGINFPLRLEPTVFAMADRLAPDYNGGYWDFVALSNGGFYMAPASQAQFQVVCENGYEGSMSADALGIAVCLYAFSHLSFSGEMAFTQKCAEHYHRLREYALGHPEVRAILAATD
jgi:hypothetical protein